MNREIKFRAWNILNKEMFCSPSEAKHLGSWFDAHLPGAVANENNIKLMQYTGLKDKNGKEIYEGDVLEKKGVYSDGREYSYKETVPFEKEFSCGCCYRVYGWQISMDIENYKIIGNVYENPELLEKENE